MLTLYPRLLSSSPFKVEESKKSYAYLTERHLQALWLEQKYFKNLQTSDGEKIEILSPGLWNSEAGPDFLKAHMRIANRDYRGDIELHLNDESWVSHGHHLDARYNNVILHVSLWPSIKRKMLYTQIGDPFFCCYLDEALKEPLARLLKLIDLDLYPYKKCVGNGKCAPTVFNANPSEQIEHLFQSAAYWRLEKKGIYLQTRLAERTNQLLGGVAMALGYKHNAEAFLELYTFLLDYRDCSYEELLALALGCCGFLEKERKSAWESSAYYQHLRLLWWEKSTEITHQAHLRLDHIRPYNHPVRRLAYLTRLLQDPQAENLWSQIWHIWQQPLALINKKQAWRLRQQELLEVLPFYPDSYWDYHFSFESVSQKKRLPGLGQELKMQILLNTYLPLLYAAVKERGHAQEWQKFQDFYHSLQTALTSKSRYLQQRFFGEEKPPAFFQQAQMIQGAYQIHKDFCIHFEASCQGCPFVARYQALQNV